MKQIIFLTLFISLTALNSWGASYFLSVGDKKVTLELEKTDWIDFCLKEKFGCARFRVQKSSNTSTFGFVKALSYQSKKEDFKQFCQDTFDQTKKIVKDSHGFSFVNDESLSHCSWSSKKETTILSYRDGITVLLSVSDNSLKEPLLTMLNKAKLHEKP